jgi:CHASE2 domain-containing sensor protein
MSKGDRRTAVALVDLAAFTLILLAALTLGLGLVSPDGSRLALVALVASIGGLLFLGLGVIRRSGTPPSVS